MPTSAEDEEPAVWLVDTSVAVPLLVSDHASHGAVVEALGTRPLGLAGHAAFETHSVMTRLPPPARRTPAAVGRLLAGNFPHSRFLDADRAGALLSGLGPRGTAGGAVYDVLVAAVALEHGLPLASRDRRALATYRDLGVDLQLLA